MAAVGGSIRALTLDGRIFPVIADNESQRKLGGWENEVAANGDGSARIIKTRVPLSIDGISVEIDDDRADHEFLQELADRVDFFAVAITYASGRTYDAQAQITGEMQVSSQSTSATFSLMGPGVLNRQ